jgi:Uma2 family endonuclease
MVGWCLRVQSAITLITSEPEPDLAIVRGHKRTYLSQHPSAKDIGLIVEVSDSTLDSDRDDKIPIYARDSIPTYWIVNLVDRQVEVHENPSGSVAVPTYGTCRTFKPGNSVPVVLDGVAVGGVLVDELLP